VKAVDSNLLTLLKKSSQFVVPIYQRVYSWEEPECEQLWRDIVRAGQNENLGAHFTGSIVYVSKGSATNTAAEPDLIIDGQQRVTTVSLLLAALASRLEMLPADQQEVHDGFSPQKIRNRYLLDENEDDDRRYKLMLSQQDRDALIAIVQGFPAPEGSRSRVVSNYEFFAGKLNNPDCDLALACRGLEKLVVVDVKLERGVDNPQLVFEAMNSTGKKLTQADLIRNFVLMDLAPSEQASLYMQYWRPMELRFPSGDESQFDAFMRHYLTIKTGKIPRIWEVYDAFKTFAMSRTQRGETIESLVLEVSEYARRYQRLALGAERDSTALRNAFKDIELIKADVVYPFLLVLYTDYEAGLLTEDEFVELMRFITSYVFRRVVCKIPTNSLNKTFATLANEIRPERYAESVQAALLKLESYRRFPTDDEFQLALVTSDVYNFRRRSYLLRKLENWGRKEPVSIEEYTIEHILPQNPDLSNVWRDELGTDWKKIQERYLHTLGNLTLTGYNSEYSDHPFLKKRDMPGGFAESPLQLNKGLGQLDTWTEVEITDRANRLAGEALLLWPAPVVSEEVLAQYQPAIPEEEYTIDDHPHLLESQRRELFEKFSATVLALDPVVTRHFLKLYVAFKAETNFVDVIPQKGRMLLTLNISTEALNDPKQICRNVEGLGRWGNGDVEVCLDENSDFEYIMGLVRQAFEFQLGED
jgi:uncharacterized protein with ParB-like and HNH nuclease domain/predicted transport protein